MKTNLLKALVCMIVLALLCVSASAEIRASVLDKDKVTILVASDTAATNNNTTVMLENSVGGESFTVGTPARTWIVAVDNSQFNTKSGGAKLTGLLNGIIDCMAESDKIAIIGNDSDVAAAKLVAKSGIKVKNDTVKTGKTDDMSGALQGAVNKLNSLNDGTQKILVVVSNGYNMNASSDGFSSFKGILQDKDITLLVVRLDHTDTKITDIAGAALAQTAYDMLAEAQCLYAAGSEFENDKDVQGKVTAWIKGELAKISSITFSFYGNKAKITIGNETVECSIPGESGAVYSSNAYVGSTAGDNAEAQAPAQDVAPAAGQEESPATGNGDTLDLLTPEPTNADGTTGQTAVDPTAVPTIEPTAKPNFPIASLPLSTPIQLAIIGVIVLLIIILIVVIILSAAKKKRNKNIDRPSLSADEEVYDESADNIERKESKKPTVMGPPSNDASPLDSKEAQDARVGARVIVRLVNREETLMGEMVNGMITVGRDSDKSTLVVSGDPRISRRHFVLAFAHDMMVLKDLSANGTFVNKQKVQDRVRLHQGDVITMGTKSYRINWGHE